ncbi:DUF58 domain-containing protein [Paucibacter sp. APW11]|uniref:DUF58 domain-containing protein n=1 Tax=Roseateles aquae TaxID=3077235 RepID=A0ABU3P989_9BURK|nr:DUF58 domain-containing protein [Paucibacter sp. APW11]MDT8999073.1 DUF58 domain-containing protein [Paucibacter sp. APW11]
MPLQAWRQRARDRWRAWWQARHPRSDAHLMTQRNLYILPTRPGLFFCLTLLVLLLASINEQLSLGFALSFILAGAGFASMHATHAVLRGLRLTLQAPAAGQAGSELPLQIQLHNEAAARWGIGLRVLGASEAQIAWTDVPAGGHAQLQLRLPALPRGHHPLPVLQIETRFPLGLFRAWSVWRPASAVWVYPLPEAPCPAWPAQPGNSQRGPARLQAAGGDDEDDIRPYRPGDAPQRILWRKAAQGDGQADSLLVREPRRQSHAELQFTWAHSAGRPLESRLSRLSAWLIRAEAEQQRYGLDLPAGLFDGGEALQLASATGPAHLDACLRALARVSTGAGAPP